MLPSVVVFWAASLASAAVPPVVVLTEPGPPSLEQQLVHQALVDEVLQTPGQDAVADRPLPAAARRANALRCAGEAHLVAAHRALRTLHPEAAAEQAAMATRKHTRLAVLTGDVAPLQQSLALEAAAYLHAGAHPAARRALTELLALSPDWRPDPSLYNPPMQRTVERVRQAVLARAVRAVQLHTAMQQAALFVDGVFAGFGEAHVELAVGVPHYVWTLPPHGEGSGDVVVPARTEGAEPLVVTLAPRLGPDLRDVTPHFGSVYAAAAASNGFTEPSLPVLAATGAREVMVLGYHDGVLRLVHFDLVRGRRQERQEAAIITQLQEARQAAKSLLQG